ncbi:MAG: hypothetical protein F6K31_10375 [Symploca sp. SIO2G7]|nr:hypothetical protein [Symploca sp. SIO2G7]
MKFQSLWQKIWNYIKTLLFLCTIAVVWSVVGWNAKHIFPPSIAVSLVNYAFGGFWNSEGNLIVRFEESYHKLWTRIQRQLYHLHDSNDIPQTNDRSEAKILSNIDSQHWLLIEILKLISQGSDNQNSLFWLVRELEEERDVIAERLNPLKANYYRTINKVQSSFSFILDSVSLIFIKGKEYEEVEEIFTYLIVKYLKSTVPTQLEVQELLEAVDKKLLDKSEIKLIYKFWRLLNWVASIEKQNSAFNSEVINYEPVDIYEKYPIRAWENKHVYHYPQGCTHYPGREKQEYRNGILFFATPQEAESPPFMLKVCGTCKKIIARKNNTAQ